MRKIFLIPLLALFTCVTAWGTNVATWDELMAAVATENASITLTATVNIPAGTHDFNGATIACGTYELKIPQRGATQSSTIQNATLTSTNNAFQIYNDRTTTLSLENVQITCTSTSTDERYKSAIWVNHGNSGSQYVYINLDANCSIAAKTGIYAAQCGHLGINNHGTINASEYGVYNINKHTFTVNNYSGATITGGKCGISSNGSEDKKVTITNEGTITGTSIAGINFYNCPNNSITNNGTINTTGSGNTSGVGTNAPLQLVNNGTIESHNAVNVQYSSNATATSITNNGTIIGHSSGLYVVVDNFQATITNASDAIIRSDGYSNSFGVSATKANIINYGQIYCTDNSMNNTAFGVGISNCNVTNEGTINRLKVYGGVNNPINNSGDITEGVKVANSCKATITNASAATLGQTLGSEGEFELTNAGTATFAGGTFGSAVSIENNGTASITAGTYNGVVTFSGSNVVDIYAGDGLTFAEVPVGSNALIHPYCVFTAGVGDLSIEEGYIWRASDGTIVEEPDWVAQVQHGDEIEKYAWVEEAFAAAEDGDVISLIKDATSTSTIWIGTESIDGTPKSLTFDLNGHTLTSASTVQLTFLLSHGALTIKNSVPGEGEIYNNYTTGTGGEIVRVHGSYLKNCNPRTQTPFSHLTIEEGVDLRTEDASGQGVTVLEINASMPAINDAVNYLTNVYGGDNVTHGVANGVRVDIYGNIYTKKYPVKVNGNIRYPDLELYNKSAVTTFLDNNFPGYSIAEADTAYSPFVHIHPSAHLVGDNTLSSSVAVYSSGYGRWIIEGSCEGASALYMKSGDVKLQNAILKCEWTGAANIVPGKQGGGVNAKGNGIVLGTEYPKYAGHMKLAVNGDTKVSTKATTGCALVDVVPGAGTSSVNEIKINGGSFSGAYAMVVTNTSISRVLVYGANLTGDETNVVVVGTETDIAPILAENVHTVVIPNNDGTTTVIVSKGETPTTVTDFGDTSNPQEGEIVSLLPGSDVKWTGTTAGIIGNGTTSTTLVLGELQIVSGTAENKQELTIKENSELRVDRLILNDNARIIIEKGAKLIVEGEQGINAPSANNIKLVSSEDVQSMFLLNPEVTSNRHPSATYTFKSKARGNTATKEYIWQRFGVPTFDGATTMTWEEAVGTALYRFDYNIRDWVAMSKGTEEPRTFIINGKPFECFLMTINAQPENDVEYTFRGELMGNGNAPLTFVKGWNSFANSYTAPIHIESLMEEIDEEFGAGVEATVFVYQRNNDQTTNWISVNAADFIFGAEIEDILPMQAFILYVHDKNLAEGEINYRRNVYDPIMAPAPSLAHAKRNANNYNGVVITVTDGVQTEKLTLLEGEEFSDDFDNKYDATKFDNENNFSLYAIQGDTKLSSMATNDLTDKDIAFDNKVAGTFTLNVTKAIGEPLCIYDMVAKEMIVLEQGSSYEFEAEAVNNAQRFVVKPSGSPTGVENVEVLGKTIKFMGNDGQIYIRRAGNFYTVDGQLVK